jgi:cell wall-associated NlpC family hydrolase
MAERFGDYTSAVNRVSQNLRALLPNTTAAGMQKRTPPLSSYITQLQKSGGGYQTQTGAGGGYNTNIGGSGLLGFKGSNPQMELFSFLNAGPKSYQDMLAQNQFNPKTSVGQVTQSNQNASVGGGNLAGTMQWRDLMEQAGAELQVPWQVLASIMAIESQGNNVNDPGGAMGLMQIMPQYWSQLAQQYGGNLQDPRTNIFTAAAILRQNYERYGSWSSAAAAYFGGAGAFNDDGSYSGSSDSYGTDIGAYVSAFDGYMQQLEYGVPTVGETFNGGNPATPNASHALEAAMSAQGAPYIWSGESWEEGGFDCSGLMQWAYQQAGIQLPRTAAEQYNATKRITSQELQPGDLIFFAGTTDAPGITHVGMYIGNGQMIQAPKEGDIVKIVSINDAYWSQHTVGYGRV